MKRGPVADLMRGMGQAARAAALVLGLAPTEQKNRALRAAAAALRARAPQILAANDEDMREGAKRELSGALLDRLRLDDSRIDAMARGLTDIERLADPIGLAEYLLAGEAKWDRYGIIDAIQKGVTMSVPLSRPIPVFVVYLTAWVDGWGDIHFQRDVYDRDSPLIRALAEPPPSPRPDGTDINVDKVGLRVVPHASGF